MSCFSTFAETILGFYVFTRSLAAVAYFSGTLHVLCVGYCIALCLLSSWRNK